MIDIRDRSIHSLTFGAILSNIGNVICIFSLMALIRHFRADTRKKINPKIKIFALLPIFTSIIVNTWFGMLGNNSVWPSINNVYPFIDEHCVTSMRLVFAAADIDMYAVSVFILMRNWYFFEGLDALQMRRSTYHAFVFIITLITVMYCGCALFVTEFGVTIFKTDTPNMIENAGKQCEVTINTDGKFNIFPFFIISNTLAQLMILLVCLQKLIILRRYLSTQKAYKDRLKSLNVNIIRRFLYLSIIFILTYWSCFMFIAIVEWSLFPFAIIIKIIAITSSFDAFQNDVHTLGVSKDDDLCVVVNAINSSKRQKKKRLKLRFNPRLRNIQQTNKIKYQKVNTNTTATSTAGETAINTRIIIKEAVEGFEGLEELSQSESELSVSRTHTHSSLKSLFGESEDEEEEEIEDHNTLNWDLSDSYIERSIIVYDTLREIFISPIYAKLIAEYSTTIFLPCVRCGLSYGFVECRYDLDTVCGTTTMMDENDEIRYYLNAEPLSLTKCDIAQKYETEMEILCLRCSDRYKCTNCGIQSLHGELLGECMVCAAVFCEFCSSSYMYGNSGENSHNNSKHNNETDEDEGIEEYVFIICAKCESNENNTKQYIFSLIRESMKSESRGLNYETSKSISDKVGAWNFPDFNAIFSTYDSDETVS